jgi:hypothetical protein
MCRYRLNIDSSPPFEAERERLTGLEGNLRALEGRLETALETYSRRDAGLGIFEALVAVQRYLDETLPARLQAPVIELIGQLADARTPGKKPLVEAARMAFAACAIDLLVETGMRPVARAARAVVREAGFSGVTARQLLEFRKNLRKGRARREALTMYDQARATWRRAMPDELLAVMPAAKVQSAILLGVRGQMLGKK